MSFIELILLLHILTLIQSLNNFDKHSDVKNCVFYDKKSNLPNCTLSIESLHDIQTNCIREGVLRVEGEYNILKLHCTADYGLDFFYNGHQPTEAVQVNWWKTVTPGTFGLQLLFNLEVTVRSVNNLFDYYTSVEPHRNHSKHIYARSGEYIFQNVFNSSVKRSFFLYLEEDLIEPTFLRNYLTAKPATITKISNEPNKYLSKLPCMRSHSRSNISVLISGERVNHNVVLDGVEIELNRIIPEDALILCILQHGNKTDRLSIPRFNLSGTATTYGLKDIINQSNRADATIEYKSILDIDSSLHIQPWCRVSNSQEKNLWLATIPSNNFGNLRMLREFVFPIYADLSYSVRRGTKFEPLSRELWTSKEDELSARFGTTFCLSGNEHRLLEYGTSHGNGEVVKIPYGMDWTLLPRDSAPIGIFFRLEILPSSYHYGELFANTTITFACRIHEAVIVKPILWFTEYKNGSVFEEYVDTNLTGPFSYFSKFATGDLSTVYCSGTFWYKELWRNISIDLKLIEGSAPEIISSETTITFRPEANNKILSCNAVGNPSPNISWQFNGIDISSGGIKTPGTLTLDLAKLQSATRMISGKYICRVANIFGSKEKTFMIEIDEGLIVNYWIIVGIPMLVILISILCMGIYVKRWQKKQIGLTRAEIEQFKRGHSFNSKRESTMNGYAHEFSHNVPYTDDNEVSKNNYQIDFSSVLGSGAYGSVYKGSLNGIPVAVKTTNANADLSYLKALLSELKIMIYLGKHPSLVEFLGSDTSKLNKGSIYIFVKLYTKGSLDSYLRENRDSLREKHNLGIPWALQICSAMTFLEEKKVIHGDLAARNVLLDNQLSAKVSDFGLSRQLVNYTDYVKKNQEPLPWRWMAVESLRDLTFSHKTDVWAFGVTLWEIFSLGGVPYPGMSYTLNFVAELENGLRMNKPKFSTPALYTAIMCECWHIDPTQRPSFFNISRSLSELGEKDSGGQTNYANTRENENIDVNYSNEPTYSTTGNLYSNTRL